MLSFQLIALIAIIIAIFFIGIFVMPQITVKQFTNVGLSRREANKIASQVLRKEKRKREFYWAC